MNRQDIFNRVATHLLKQGAKAQDGYTCKYLTPAGLKCGIGAIIPDGHEAQSFDGFIHVLLKRDKFKDLKQLWEVESDEDIYFLSQLQEVHDVNDVCDWRAKLNALAARYKLQPIEVSNGI